MTDSPRKGDSSHEPEDVERQGSERIETSDEATTVGEPTVRPDATTLLTRAAELLGASTLAVAQPLFSLLGDNPVFFVAHGVTGWRLLTFALLLTLAVPAVLFVVLTAVSYVVPLVGAWAHDVVVGTLVAIILGPPIARALGLGAVLWMLTLVVLAVGATILIRRAAPARSFLRILAAAPILFVGFFLFASPASDLFTSGDDTIIPTLSGPDTAPVVWLVLDQFPMPFIVDEQGDIVAERFPNLARLAELSTWYPNATAGTVRTDVSVPAALTGTWPKWRELPVASQQPSNLFGLLGSDEYPVKAEEYVTQLCPSTICGDDRQRPDSTWADTRAVWVRYALPSSVADSFVPPIDDRWDGFGDRADGDAGSGSDVIGEARNQEDIRKLRALADENSVRFARFLEPLKQPEVHGVHYAHLFLPHEPFRYLPDGRTMDLVWGILPDDEGRWPDSEPLMRTRLQHAISQAMYADHIVGELLDALEDSGAIDDVLLVVMSDHGASTRPGMLNRTAVDRESMVDSVPIPLFIKAPGQTGGAVDERVVQQVDILPTVLYLLGIEIALHDDGSRVVLTEGQRGNIQFDGYVATHDVDTSFFDTRTLMRLTEDGLEPFPNPPKATDSPTIAWMDDVFADPSSPYILRPFEDVMGQTILETTVTALSDAPFTITLDSPAAFDNVDLGGSKLPNSVTGVITGVSQPQGLAVVVNGVVVGATETFNYDGEHRFAVLISPESLVDGPNVVSFLAVEMSNVETTPLNGWSRVTTAE